MDNPYQSPEIGEPELAELRKRPVVWKSLLVAYVVHHGAVVAGILAGLAVAPHLWIHFFPPDRPWESVATLAAVPVIDLYCLLEPLAADVTYPSSHMALRWTRSALVLTLPIAMLIYGFTRRRLVLAYVGVATLLITLSLVYTFNIDNAAHSVSAEVSS